MNVKRIERKTSRPNRGTNQAKFLEGLMKTTKISSQDSPYPGKDLNQAVPEYRHENLFRRLILFQLKGTNSFSYCVVSPGCDMIITEVWDVKATLLLLSCY
jgi:hypothetical protein